MLSASYPFFYHRAANGRHHGGVCHRGHDCDQGGICALFPVLDILGTRIRGASGLEGEVIISGGHLQDRLVHELRVKAPCILVSHVQEVIELVLVIFVIHFVKLISRVEVRHLTPFLLPLFEHFLFKVYEFLGSTVLKVEILLLLWHQPCQFPNCPHTCAGPRVHNDQLIVEGDPIGCQNS